MGPVWPLWCVAGCLGFVWKPWGRCRSPGPRMAAVSAWAVPWAPYGCRGGVVVPLGLVSPPWGCGLSLGPHMEAVGAWPVSWVVYRHRGAWPFPWVPHGRRGSVAGPLGPVWPPWGVTGLLGPVRPPWRRGRFPSLCIKAVGAWLVPWVLYGRRRGVANPLVSYGNRGGVAGPLVPVWLPWGCGRSPGPLMAAVVAWPVPWASHGCRGGVAGSLRFV